MGACGVRVHVVCVCAHGMGYCTCVLVYVRECICSIVCVHNYGVHGVCMHVGVVCVHME